MQFSKIVLALSFALGVMSIPTAKVDALAVRDPVPHLTDANVGDGCGKRDANPEEFDADSYYQTGC